VSSQHYEDSLCIGFFHPHHSTQKISFLHRKGGELVFLSVPLCISPLRLFEPVEQAQQQTNPEQ
jgi:hypothetical protein